MKLLSMIWEMLTAQQRRGALRLLALMMTAMVVETLGIGLVLPAMAVLLERDIATAYPATAPWMERLGNPTQVELVVGGMIVVAAAYVLRTAFLAWMAWRQSGFAYGVQADLSERLLTAYLAQPYTFHLQRNSAELIRNATREVELFTLYCLLNILMIGSEVLVVVGIAALLLIMEPVGALSIALVLSLAAWSYGMATRRRLHRWGAARQMHDGLRLQHLHQALGGAKEVILMGRGAEFTAQYATHNSASADMARRQATVAQLPRLWLELLAVLGLSALVIVMVARGRDVGSVLPALGLFAAAGFRLMPSVNRIMTSLQGFRYGVPTIRTLHQELQIPAIPPRVAGEDICFEREIRLDAVSFRYPGAATPALREAAFSVAAGEMIGFIGPSGSGKSTLVDVVLGLLAPDAGSVRIDGRDIRDGLRAWQDRLGYVPQSIYLTDDSVARNVAFGLPDHMIDEVKVWSALADAQLDEFVRSLPQGLGTMVGERGISLSGGQRQRIGIARALYHDPDVLILDEATSALDGDTERGVLHAVSQLHGRKTILIVAHRLSTLASCDRIYRIESGRIVEAGTPERVLSER